MDGVVDGWWTATMSQQGCDISKELPLSQSRRTTPTQRCWPAPPSPWSTCPDKNPLHPRYSITRFLSVQRANIGGGQYDMEVEVMSQPQTEEQADGDSTRTPPSEQQVLRCHFVVLSVPWKDQRVLLHSSCSPVSSTAQEF
ncbi:hypothetical protein COCON_G00194080 [Conger conger]|uniref:Uncharacterized protein n=1 Tax=Conger conger TaxID=82655 RepID=A0A9Q1HQL9_CONCO|nr:hypothetical protein COCON_G00194080 [Conger conger]